MNHVHRFYSLIAILATLIIMFLAACVLAYNNRSVEAIGIAAIMTGLIGIAGTLVGQRQPTDQVEITNPPEKPVPTTEAQP